MSTVQEKNPSTKFKAIKVGRAPNVRRQFCFLRGEGGGLKERGPKRVECLHLSLITHNKGEFAIRSLIYGKKSHANQANLLLSHKILSPMGVGCIW